MLSPAIKSLKTYGTSQFHPYENPANDTHCAANFVKSLNRAKEAILGLNSDQLVINQSQIIDKQEDLFAALNVINSDAKVILIQTAEHKLRSYQPIQCWIVLTALCESARTSSMEF